MNSPSLVSHVLWQSLSIEVRILRVLDWDWTNKTILSYSNHLFIYLNREKLESFVQLRISPLNLININLRIFLTPATSNDGD